MNSTASAMRSAQLAWDNMAEPEMSDLEADVESIREQIRLAEEYIARAERSLRVMNVDAALDHLSGARRELGAVTE